MAYRANTRMFERMSLIDTDRCLVCHGCGNVVNANWSHEHIKMHEKLAELEARLEKLDPTKDVQERIPF